MGFRVTPGAPSRFRKWSIAKMVSQSRRDLQGAATLQLDRDSHSFLKRHNCGRADYGNVGHDCDSCLLWVQLPPATLISRKENCRALGVQRNAIHEQILSLPVRCGDGCEKCGG